jgi:thiopeptide-type bacteriocin biosynthesis protein
MPRSPSRARATRPASLQVRYRPLDHLVVRAPLLPVESYRALSGNGTAPAGAGVGAWARPLVRQALTVASPSLVAALDRPDPDGAGAARARDSLLRYLIRMSTRPTPFGLFAGTGIARWSDRTDLELAGPPRTRTRLDMEWLLDLVLRLEADPGLRRQLRLVANPAAFAHGGRIHLSERAPTAASSGGPRAGALDAQPGAAPAPDVSVRATGAVRLALALARRPVRYADLAARLQEGVPGATPQRVDALVAQLCEATLLLTDLRPPLTVTDPAGWVIDRLTAAGSPAAGRLAGLVADVAALDRVGPGAAVTAAARLDERAATLAGRRAVRSALQVDAALELGGTGINRAVGEAVAGAAELLLRLSPLPEGPPHLAAYRRAFQRRYGTDRTVPLLELLDPRFGLGPLGRPGAPADRPRSAGEGRDQLLLDLAGRALADRRMGLELDGELAGRLATWTPDPAAVPATLELYVGVAAGSAAAIDAGAFTVVVGHAPGTAPAGRNLGRFADLLGPAGRAALVEAAGAGGPARPGVVVAELAYLPRRLRQANVAVRPGVHGHELVAATSPGVAPERVIPLDELVVGVAGGRLRLWWPAGGAEVEVAAGHMLNPTGAPAVVRFLAEVGRDGRAQLGGFSWGPAAGLPFLPRVQAGRVVLRPASWRLGPGDLDGGFEAGLGRWRAALAVPRHVRAGPGDRRMLLDLDDPAQAGQLRADLAAGRPVVLHEALPGPDDAWLPGPAGRFLAELVVPLRLATPPAPPPTAPVPPGRRPPARRERLRPPGSDWLYAKLYGPRQDEEELLSGAVRELAEAAVRDGDADGWHFLRYGDPEPHLRLRFRGDPGRLTGVLLPRLGAWAAGLVDAGGCERFVLDTYEREVERYGGPEGMAAAEDLFAADSRCVAGLLALAGPAWPLDRVGLAVVTLDDLLAGLGLDPGRRLALLGRRVGDRRASGAEHRRRKATLRPLLADPGRLAAEPAGAAILGLLAGRRAALAPVAARLAGLAAAGRLGGRGLDELAASFAHLHCNRLLGPDPAAERLVTGLLLRTRESLERAPLAHPG